MSATQAPKPFRIWYCRCASCYVKHDKAQAEALCKLCAERERAAQVAAEREKAKT